MGSDNVFGIEPPKDAEGKVIPLDTDVLYSESGKVFNVECFRYSLIDKEWLAYGRYRGSEAERSGCGETNHYFLTTHDSWDKLIDDLRSSTGRYMAACAYFNPAGKDCAECQQAAFATMRHTAKGRSRNGGEGFNLSFLMKTISRNQGRFSRSLPTLSTPKEEAMRISDEERQALCKAITEETEERR